MTDLDFHYSPPSVAAFATANDPISRSLPRSLETVQLSEHGKSHYVHLSATNY
jgi:hypothetical protein